MLFGQIWALGLVHADGTQQFVAFASAKMRQVMRFQLCNCGTDGKVTQFYPVPLNHSYACCATATVEASKAQRSCFAVSIHLPLAFGCKSAWRHWTAGDLMFIKNRRLAPWALEARYSHHWTFARRLFLMIYPP